MKRSAMRRILLTTPALFLALALLGAMAAPLAAQTYPGKPVRFILPFPPGGPTDILGRIIGQKLAERLGQPLIPENRPGSGGNIGIELAAQAKPDGYTIVLTTSTLAISPSLYKKMNYDPVKDLAPISLVAEIPNVLCVRAGLPVTNLKELIAYAKTNPTKINYGTGGVGTSSTSQTRYSRASRRSIPSMCPTRERPWRCWASSPGRST